jgi:RNA polymerase sigma-70 factor, ECF subfamily
VSGDEGFDRVVKTYGAALRRLAGAWAIDRAGRDDLVQEIFIALWRALPRFRGESAERTFVFRVAMNRALTHRFRQPPRGEPLDAASHLADPGRSPEAEASTSEQRTRLLGALHALPPSHRQLLALSLEGLTTREIADVLGITENNAGVRLTRARRVLQESLQTPDRRTTNHERKRA